MATKIKVIGKSQNREALGIINAWLVMNPSASIKQLEAAFPESIALDNGTKRIFIPADELKANPTWDGYFKADNELLTVEGKKVAVNKMWTKPSLENLEKAAAPFGIEGCVDKSVQGEAGFSLEFLNGYRPPKAKKGCLGILLLPLIAAAGTIAFLFA